MPGKVDSALPMGNDSHSGFWFLVLRVRCDCSPVAGFSFFSPMNLDEPFSFSLRRTGAVGTGSCPGSCGAPQQANDASFRWQGFKVFDDHLPADHPVARRRWLVIALKSLPMIPA